MLKLENLKNIKINFLSLKEKKWLLPIISATVLLLSLFFLFISFQVYYQNRFFLATKIGDLDYSGLTKSEALEKLEDKAYEIDNRIIKIRYQNNDKEEILVIDLSSDIDIAGSFFDYDAYQTIEENYKIARSGNIFSNLVQQTLIYLGLQEFKNYYEINEDLILKTIKNELSTLEVAEKNAYPEIACSNECQVEIIAEQQGTSFNYAEAIGQWSEGLNNFSNGLIELKAIAVTPEIRKSEIDGIKDKLQSFLVNFSEAEFNYQDNSYKLSRKNLAGMIIFLSDQGEIKIGLDQEKFFKWFESNIGTKLNIAAKNATIEIKNGKVTSLSTHKNGQAVDVEQVFKEVSTKLAQGETEGFKFDLMVKEVLPEVKTEDVNNLGIKEILGTGESNFAGSSASRIKNIRVGANKLHGMLIKPDEEFSLMQSLLPVDASSGYVQELVIRDNRTIAEYGGGLCQVGTTMFRSAMAVGLPILERRNHSFSVSYYLENGLPGTDATIYDPSPDFRFKNDTGNYILIQARIEGSKLYFDFWGTSDGRIASRTKPRTWGVRSPPPTKTVVSNNLKPGERKCTETARNGISTAFDYTVTYAGMEPITTTFTSVYRPWQEVCLVGPEAVIEETETEATQEETTDTLPVAEENSETN
jgi:vancomycin resistance protein YoaR